MNLTKQEVLRYLESVLLELSNRTINILFTFDCFVFSVCTLGKAYPGESFSSAAYRAELKGMFYGKARPIIDKLFELLGQTEHCKKHYLSTRRMALPDDMP
jgi:hypothetical protein